MSIRELTKTQGANGTAISGVDLDKTAHDTAATLNNLKPSHLRRNLTRQVMVMGHSPQPFLAAPGEQLAWFTNRNSALSVTTLEPPTVFNNPWRYKGDWNDDIDPTTVASGNLWSMEWAWIHPRPAILRRVVVSALTDSNFNNNFQYVAPGPPNHAAAGSVFDLTAAIYADDQYNQDQRSRQLVPVLKRAFTLDSARLKSGATAPDTMLPAYPTGSADGLMFDVAPSQDSPLDIPVPALTRLRLLLSIPEYPTPAWSSWGQFPWELCLWGITVWYDEVNTDG